MYKRENRCLKASLLFLLILINQRPEEKSRDGNCYKIHAMTDVASTDLFEDIPKT